jgi:HEAT repeat protein
LALAALLWREQDAVPKEPLMRTAQAAFAAFNRAADGLLTPPQWARVLGSLAWTMQLTNGYQADLQAFEQAVTDLLDTTYDASADLRNLTEEEEEEKPDFARQGRNAFSALLRTGDLVCEVGRGQVAFVHPTFRAYFAAQHAARVDESTTLIDRVRDPQWQDTILFYSALTNVAPLVMARLKATDDLFRSGFFAAAGYLAASPEADDRLRGGVLAELAQVFLNPMQPTALGRRAAETIALSRDKGSIYLFGQAMSHKDAHIRLLGVWGLSQLEDRRALAGLQRALTDPDRLVRIEALHALAASSGKEASLDGLVQGLQDEDELTRRVAAQLLSSAGKAGHDLLRQAVESEDMYIRRAGVFGLGAVREPWATDTVDHMRREDDEWFVRSAATEVMDRLTAPPPPIAPQALKERAPEWLSSWAAEHKVTLDSAEAALRAAVQAIQHDEWPDKLAAGELMRVLGGPEAIPALKEALKDENRLVREMAFGALQEISTRIGSHIPA